MTTHKTNKPRSGDIEFIMGSFTQLSYHIVFGTKYRKAAITHELGEPLYRYIGGIVRSIQGSTVEVGGVADDAHILAELPPARAVASVIRDVKASSSRWVNERQDRAGSFEWQKGYGAFTLSYDRKDTVARYIRNQEEHHKRITFQDEYIGFLKRHGIEFQMKWLFEGEHHG